jgi:hypothetical protein
MRFARVDNRASRRFFGIQQSRIFQIIETEAAYFTEIETGALMIVFCR